MFVFLYKRKKCLGHKMSDSVSSHNIYNILFFLKGIIDLMKYICIFSLSVKIMIPDTFFTTLCPAKGGLARVFERYIGNVICLQ